MDDKEKVKFSDEEIEGIAKAIALAKGRTLLQSDSQSKIRSCL